MPESAEKFLQKTSNDHIRDLENYGYKTDVFLGNSDHVRITVLRRHV